MTVQQIRKLDKLVHDRVKTSQQGRCIHPSCRIPMSCVHHIIPKQRSLWRRYVKGNHLGVCTIHHNEAHLLGTKEYVLTNNLMTQEQYDQLLQECNRIVKYLDYDFLLDYICK